MKKISMLILLALVAPSQASTTLLGWSEPLMVPTYLTEVQKQVSVESNRRHRAGSVSEGT